MHLNTAVISFIIASLICFPLYRYFFRAASTNSDGFDDAFKKEYDEDTVDSLLTSYGEGEGIARRHLYTTAFLMLIPVFVASILATGIYLLLVYLGLPSLVGHY